MTYLLLTGCLTILVQEIHVNCNAVETNRAGGGGGGPTGYGSNPDPQHFYLLKKVTQKEEIA
jgi:hypothetical protein